MTLLRRSLLVLPLAMTAARVVAQSVWYAVRGADRSFIVDMPGEPVYKLIDATSRGPLAMVRLHQAGVMKSSVATLELDVVDCPGPSRDLVKRFQARPAQRSTQK